MASAMVIFGAKVSVFFVTTKKKGRKTWDYSKKRHQIPQKRHQIPQKRHQIFKSQRQIIMGSMAGCSA